MMRWWYLAPLLLSGCSQVEQKITNDPASIQQANLVLLAMVVAMGAVGVAWAIAWAFVNRRGDR